MTFGNPSIQLTSNLMCMQNFIKIFKSFKRKGPFLDLHLTISDGFVSSETYNIPDLHLSISDDFVSSIIYDKRDDFEFANVNFPFLDGDIPRATSYGVYTSQLIRFDKVSSHVADFNTIN